MDHIYRGSNMDHITELERRWTTAGADKTAAAWLTDYYLPRSNPRMIQLVCWRRDSTELADINKIAKEMNWDAQKVAKHMDGARIRIPGVMSANAHASTLKDALLVVTNIEGNNEGDIPAAVEEAKAQGYKERI